MSRISRLAVRQAEYYDWQQPVESTNALPGAWIEVEKISDGRYKLVGSSLTDQWRPAVAVSAWDKDVRVSNYDNYDPPFELWWNDITMNMLEGEFHAPNIVRLREAMNHVAFMGWDPADV
jgi:hypothetical protein